MLLSILNHKCAAQIGEVGAVLTEVYEFTSKDFAGGATRSYAEYEGIWLNPLAEDLILIHELHSGPPIVELGEDVLVGFEGDFEGDTNPLAGPWPKLAEYDHIVFYFE